MNMRDVLLYFALKYDGNFPNIYNALQNKELVDWELFKELKERCQFNYVTIIDQDYPWFFKNSDFNCPPIVLFYLGDKELLESDDFEEFTCRNLTRSFRTEKNGKKLIAFESSNSLQEGFNQAMMNFAIDWE